jgi:pyruvate/2-oxoglutarate/acetoin dehydrogenase E1 component
MRQISYAQAINEAQDQALTLSTQVLLLGQMIDYKSGVFGTTTGLVDKHGRDRVQDFPVAESIMTSTAIGAAIAGLRPVVIHQRVDFMMYSLDAIVNWLSLWRLKSDGKSGLPVTIRAVVGKGWGQGPQHSKSPHAWFAHLPGIRVAMPATPYDAKGLLLESIFSEDPAVFFEHRSLFSMVDVVPAEPYRVRFGEAALRRRGSDLTIVALGSMVPVALRAALLLSADGIDAEVLDLRTVSPLDATRIIDSVTKTRRLLVADAAWQSCSVAAEVIALVCEQLSNELKARPARLCLPDSHTPMSAPLETAYYPDEHRLAQRARTLFTSAASGAADGLNSQGLSS